MDVEFYIVGAFFCFSSLNFLYEWKIPLTIPITILIYVPFTDFLNILILEEKIQ